MLISGITLSYLAWFGFYHSEKKRSPYGIFNKSLVMRRTTITFSWISAFLALYPCVLLVGMERGVAMWLALLTGMGLFFIFSVHTHPSMNKAVAIGSLIIALPSFLLNT